MVRSAAALAEFERHQRIHAAKRSQRRETESTPSLFRLFFPRARMPTQRRLALAERGVSPKA